MSSQIVVPDWLYVFVLPGSSIAVTTVERSSGVKAIALASDGTRGPLIGYESTGGAFWVKEGSLNAPWVEEWKSGVRAIALASDDAHGPLIGYVSSSGTVWVKQTKLSVPVLMDSDGKVAESYGVEGIPTTVVIGTDGKVRKVFVGFSDDGETQLKSAIQDAMK